MKTLALLRHAKSSWSDGSHSDRERPLSARGLAAAPRMGEHLVAVGPPPALVLCSAAQRTRETLALLGLPERSEVRVEEVLYLADLDTLVECVAGLPDAVPDALLIGHNPGVGELAGWLVGNARSAPALAMREKFPTAALARLRLPVARWRDVEAGCAELLEFTRPSDL